VPSQQRRRTAAHAPGRRRHLARAPEPPAPALLHANVHDELSRRFITGKVTPGSTISTRGLAEELGVSQTPVREALSRLAAEGAVHIRSKRKIVIPSMTEERFKNLLRCRELLEPEAAMLALPFIDAGRLQRLKQADASIGEALESGDVNAYMQGNFDFHFLIYGAGPRSTLNQLIEILWLQFGPYMRVVYGRVGTANLVDQHALAIKAIGAGDARRLGRAILADIRDGMGLIGKRGIPPG